jgi:hypothetical protein
MPDDLAEPVVAAACFLFCRRAMGEAVTRHSLRPLRFFEGGSLHNSGAIRAAGTWRRISTNATKLDPGKILQYFYPGDIGGEQMEVVMDRDQRKAAVTAYQERKAIAGIYAVICRPSGQRWIGRALDLGTVQNRLWFTLRQGGYPYPHAAGGLEPARPRRLLARRRRTPRG